MYDVHRTRIQEGIFYVLAAQHSYSYSPQKGSPRVNFAEMTLIFRKISTAYYLEA